MGIPASGRGSAYWVVVADESSAVGYGGPAPRKPETELFRLENEDARRKTGELLSDRGGRSFDSHGHGRHTMTREKDAPKQRAGAAFAREIATRIARALTDGSCEGYALLASPRFLGELRDALASRVKTKPYATIDKDVVDADLSVVQQLLMD